jgi:hypothetical protein
MTMLHRPKTARSRIDLRGYRDLAQQSSVGAIDAARSRARDH